MYILSHQVVTTNQSIAMANVYALRIHELADDCRRRVIALCESTGGSYVVAREADAARPHFQGWIRTDIKDKALRSRVKKAFPECIGNKGYSLGKVRDLEAYSRYVLKGTREEIADIVAAYGLEITPEYLANEHRAYWSAAEKPSKSNRSLVEEVHEWAVEQRREKEVTRRDIAQRVCDTLAARKKAISVFHVRGVTNTVAYLTDLMSREIIIDEIVNKY